MRNLFLLSASAAALAGCGGGSVDETAADGASGPQNEIEFATPTPTPTPTPTATFETGFAIERRQVQIGLDGPNVEACGRFGEITGLNTERESFVVVRNAPDSDADEVGRVSNGTGIAVCENANGWLGIVYLRSGVDGANCGVSEPVPRPQDYNGSCRSGWINRNFYELVTE